MAAAPPPALADLLQHAGWVRKLALQLCADVHRAEDAAQETWAAVLRNPPRDVRSARSFVVRTLQNALALTRRTEGRRLRREAAVAVPIDATTESAADLVAKAELHRALVGLVLRLPEPQRELVLRHYFEAEPLPVLARRLSLSVDAVRAHLRRSRERLRAELERADDDVRRAFAALLVGTQPSAMAVAGAATLGGLFMKGKLVAAAAIVLLAGWWIDPFALRSVTEPPGAAAVAVAPSGSRDGESGRDALAAVERQAAPVAKTLAGRLEGLHAAARWTATLAVRISTDEVGAERTAAAVARVADDGSFLVTLPEWTANATALTIKLQAEDPWYVPVTASFVREAGASDALVLPVQPVSVVAGRVVDENGRAVVSACIGAFVMDEGKPLREATAIVETGDDGEFRLRLPLASRVLVLAAAMHAGNSANVDSRGNRRPELDLLPAGTDLAIAFGFEALLEPLVVRHAALVTGTVRWPDGTPIVGAELAFAGSCDARPQFRGFEVYWWRGGAAALEPLGTTDENGSYAIASPAGLARRMRLWRLPGVLVLTHFESHVTAPSRLDFRLEGRLVKVVTTVAGQTGPTMVELTTPGHSLSAGVGPEGVRLLLADGVATTLRVSAHECAPFELMLRAEEAPPVLFVDLQRSTEPRTEVRLAVAGDPPLQSAWLWCEPLAAGLRPFHAALTWTAPGFASTRLPPGRYRLMLLPAAHEGPDSFLVEQVQEAAIPDTLHGLDLRLATQRGGRLRFVVRDGDGLRVAGELRLRRDGVEVAPSPAPHLLGPRPRRQGRLDVATDFETSNLAPGTYDVELDFGPRGEQRQTAVVRAGDVVEVRVRVP